MNPLKTLQTLLAHVTQPKGIPKLNPSRDWIVLLACTLILLLASLAWNGWYFFFELTKESLPNVSVEQTAVDTASLEKVEALFEMRATEQGRYGSEYQFIDPSR